MNKVKLLWSKRTLVAVLSLGIMILGIECIAWAMISMRAHSDYSSDASSAKLNYHTNKILLPGYTAGGGKMELYDSLVLPAPNKALYPEYPMEGDNIGSLTIPALKRKIPILQGTGENELKKGAGHFNQSVLPGEEDNCVISGHRDTVFRQLGNLEIGDQLIVKTSAGTFTYGVSGTRIVHEDDKTVIVPTFHAVLTLTTCYPFYIPGFATDRYIVSADLVKSLLTIKSNKDDVSEK